MALVAPKMEILNNISDPEVFIHYKVQSIFNVRKSEDIS
jgi:hypothetical protein